MADFVGLAGQALSVGGLLYGWYVTLAYCDEAADARAGGDKQVLLHHLAMA
jgi:hypothetical protein